MCAGYGRGYGAPFYLNNFLRHCKYAVSVSTSCLLPFFHDWWVVVVPWGILCVFCAVSTLHEVQRNSYRARNLTGCLQLFEIITSGRHLWPGHPPFIQGVLVFNLCRKRKISLLSKFDDKFNPFPPLKIGHNITLLLPVQN